MPPRASWKGQLKLSLVSFPVRLHNVISTTERVSLNQLHAGCNRRLRQQMICPEHGPVERSEISKGYEYEKDKYVVMEEADLEAVRLDTTKSIELVQFVDEEQLDQLYLNASYFVAPDGPVADEAFRVFREAMKRQKKVAIGRVVMSNRENIVALRPEGKGFVLTTLHYASEVRSAEPYFEDIKDGTINESHMKLAEQLIESNAAEFTPSEFNDRYQDALLDVIKRKLDGEKPVVVQHEEAGKVINLMEALKASVAEQMRKKPPAESVSEPAAATKTRRRKQA
jgi:DNA end-binding protein Ku